MSVSLALSKGVLPDWLFTCCALFLSKSLAISILLSLQGSIAASVRTRPASWKVSTLSALRSKSKEQGGSAAHVSAVARSPSHSCRSAAEAVSRSAGRKTGSCGSREMAGAEAGGGRSESTSGGLAVRFAGGCCSVGTAGALRCLSGAPTAPAPRCYGKVLHNIDSPRKKSIATLPIRPRRALTCSRCQQGNTSVSSFRLRLQRGAPPADAAAAANAADGEGYDQKEVELKA